MSKQRYVKLYKSYEEDICMMNFRNIRIDDNEKAKEYLRDIGYYRLGYYIFPFEKTYPKIGSKRKREVVLGTTIEDVVAFYYYNMDLRNIMNKYLSRIEIAVRAAMVHELSSKYNTNPFWYVDKNIVNKDFIKKFKVVYDKNIKCKEPIQRFHARYRERFAPVWKTMEYTTFGNLENLYANLLNSTDQSLVSKHFGEPSVQKFGNYLSVMREVRNACAHSNVIVELALTNTIKSGSKACPTMKRGMQNTLGGALRIIGYMLRQISRNRALDMQNEIIAATQSICTKVPYLQPMIEQKTGIMLPFTL